MIGVRIERTAADDRQTSVWFDDAVNLAAPRRELPREASESDGFTFDFSTGHTDRHHFRIFVGDVLVASNDPSDAGGTPREFHGQFLADWVGLAEFAIWQRPERGDWQKLLTIPVAVSAGKMKQEEFEYLFADLEREAAELLFDIHGKTRIGLRSRRGLSSAAPLATLARLRETVRELREAWPALARRPASRLRMTMSRELATAGQTVSDGTLAEIARDPSMVRRAGGDHALVEYLREDPRPDYRLAEHRAIADFLFHMQGQLAELRPRIESEIRWRESRKLWRNHTPEAGRATWWQTDDLPRIEELKTVSAETTALAETIRRLATAAFLPTGRALVAQPEATPRFLHSPHYRRIFHAIDRHFQSFEMTFETDTLLSRVRSLPVLYELWCVVRVLRILSEGLRPTSGDAGSLLRSTAHSVTTQFSLDLKSNRAVDFEDPAGNRVRFRYQPEYRATYTGIGPLDGASLRTPDMSLEISRANNRTAVPDSILIFDAKYSHVPHARKLADLGQHYGRIGDPRTGRVLSRQVWALTPAEVQYRTDRHRLPGFATVDNLGFWSPDFDPTQPVFGALETRPTRPGMFDPLRELMLKLLSGAGAEWTGE